MENLLNLSVEEMDRLAEKIAKDIIQQQEATLRLVYKDRYRMFPLVAFLVRKKGAINEENIPYFPEEYPFTQEEFQHFFTSITDYIGGEFGSVEDKTYSFENKSFFLRDGEDIFKFFIMWGQGSWMMLQKLSEEEKEDVPESLMGSYPGYLKYIEKEYQSIEKKEEKAD